MYSGEAAKRPGETLGLSEIKVGRTYQVMHGATKRAKITIITKPDDNGNVFVEYNFYGDETLKEIKLSDYGVIAREDGTWELSIWLMR